MSSWKLYLPELAFRSFLDHSNPSSVEGVMAERVQLGLFGPVRSISMNRCRLGTTLAESYLQVELPTRADLARFCRLGNGSIFFCVVISSYFDHNLSYRPPNEVWFEAMETLKSPLQFLCFKNSENPSLR